jgi:large subunit ribosomal protein L11
VFSDRSFKFTVKTPIASDLIKRAAGIPKGSGVPNREKVGKITLEQVKEIAKVKMADLYAMDEQAAVNTIKGTARSMGVDVVD